MSITAHASSASPIFLDLTLRDVGYYNAWGFAPGLVSNYLPAKQDTKIYLGALLMKVYGEKNKRKNIANCRFGKPRHLYLFEAPPFKPDSSIFSLTATLWPGTAIWR